jgi:hypothetical protein
LAIVCIECCNMYRMVVIPHRARFLVVWVVVILMAAGSAYARPEAQNRAYYLVLAGLNHILCPTIEGGARV